MSRAVNQDWQAKYRAKLRLRRIWRASLILNGLVFAATYLPIPFLADLTLTLVALIASLIGIAAVLWLWRLDSKQ